MLLYYLAISSASLLLWLYLRQRRYSGRNQLVLTSLLLAALFPVVSVYLTMASSALVVLALGLPLSVLLHDRSAQEIPSAQPTSATGRPQLPMVLEARLPMVMVSPVCATADEEVNDQAAGVAEEVEVNAQAVCLPKGEAAREALCPAEKETPTHTLPPTEEDTVQAQTLPPTEENTVQAQTLPPSEEDMAAGPTDKNPAIRWIESAAEQLSAAGGLDAQGLLAVTAPTRCPQHLEEAAIMQLINDGFDAYESGQYDSAITAFFQAWQATQDPDLKILVGNELIQLYKGRCTQP